MDKFTRNYSIVLGLVVLIVVVWALYEDPLVSELNDLLEQDPDVASYPYQFKVLRVQTSTAIMSTPRTSEFPVHRMLGVLFPHLSNRDQDNPDMIDAQQELARVQKRAKAIVMESEKINYVRWELDKNWLSQKGVQVGMGY
jgi:hypothetical protein